MNRQNLILLADTYKYSHYKLYVPVTSTIYSYLESRGGLFNETVFYGLQYFLKEYLQGEVFTKQKIDEAIYSLDNNKGISNDLVMEETKNRYPKYFN